MKKILLFAVAIILFAFNNSVKAQGKIKEGKIKFEMSYPDSGESAEILKMMPKESVIYFKNGDTRSEMQMGMGDMTMIRYAKSGDTYTLMDMMGKKIAMKMTKDYMNKFKDSLKLQKPVITMTDETKTIAFFKCRKAIVTMMFKGEKKSYEVWVTNEIDNIDLGEYKMEGVDGFTMELAITEKGTTVHMLCTSIEQIAVPDSLFKIPDGYEVMSMDNMMKGMGSRH